MGAPPLYVDPSLQALVQMVPGVPPASRIGRLALSGRKPAELAFVAGRYLAGFREERFREPKLMYRNLGGRKFAVVSEQLGPDFLRPVVGRGLAVAVYTHALYDVYVMLFHP